jgi:hypothetical protein
MVLNGNLLHDLKIEIGSESVFFGVRTMKLPSHLLVIAGLTSQLACTQAFSTGAGGCNGGIAAVEGLHLGQGTTNTGTLADGGLTLFVDDVQVDTSNTILLEVSATSSIFISGTNDYKGVLYRLQSTDGSDATGMITVSDGDADTQLSDKCVAPVAGVTHTNANEKNNVPATLNTGDEPASYLLDVTVVVANSGDVSEYYFTQYTITVDSTSGGGQTDTSPSLPPDTFAPTIIRQTEPPAPTENPAPVESSPAPAPGGDASPSPTEATESPAAEAPSPAEVPNPSPPEGPTGNSGSLSFFRTSTVKLVVMGGLVLASSLAM